MADALLLQRRAPAAAELMVNQEAPTQNLNAADFDFSFHAGVDVSVARHFNSCSGVGVRYFGLDPWTSSTSAATTPGAPLHVNTVPPGLTVEAGSSIHARCKSDLQNFEINGRQQLGERLTMLVGFRYLELDERFDAALAGAEFPITYEAATRNRLYGVQFGGQAGLWDGGGPLTIEGVGKAGIFGNRAAQDSKFGAGYPVPARGTAIPTALVGDIGLSANYCFTDRLSLRGQGRKSHDRWRQGQRQVREETQVATQANLDHFGSRAARSG